ncbi:hypothetical protein P3339_09265 [Microbulbifer sp. MLAF003]|uniref:hypothetical protein n=1 Tax=unclassified Microbulbifer TaxID=2619833 RepID=UPI0024ADE8AC|nr:hypothetical protein [Microbulbifer sp. MLAF003]WHI52930.1 hypothetical protein P3339_09265 [Microbulbifer sp. MLAF003]
MKYKPLFVCIVFLSGCDGAIDKFLDKSSDTFNASYKESFVEACVKPENTDEKGRVCSCLADDLIDNHSPRELIDQERVEKYIEEVAIQKCIGEREVET